MPEKEMCSWTEVQMFCPNCGTLNVGYKDQEGKYRFRCKRCGVVMLRSYKNRRQDVIEVTQQQDRGLLAQLWASLVQLFS